MLLMVGPYGDWLKFSAEPGTVLVPECDGVRILTARSHALLRRVPDALAAVFRTGSTEPGVWRAAPHQDYTAVACCKHTVVHCSMWARHCHLC